MRTSLLLVSILINFCGLQPLSGTVVAAEVVVQSPNNRLRLVLTDANDDGGVKYSVSRDGQPLIEPSPLSIRLKDMPAISASARIAQVAENAMDNTSALPLGKSDRLHDNYRAARAQLKSADGLEWYVELRAYNDGVALRYGFLQQDRLRQLLIESEATEFRVFHLALVATAGQFEQGEF